MPAMASRGRGRRTINEINMVPFIDVMLVLLIIFMVSAPLMTPGVVELPSVGQAKRQPDKVIEVVIDPDERLRVRVNGAGDGERLGLNRLSARVKSEQRDDKDVPVIISADKGVKYEAVVKVMDTLQRAGVARVGLAVRTTGATERPAD